MGHVKQAAGAATQAVELNEGGTVGDLLRELVAANGEAFKRLVVTEDGSRRPSVLLFVGEELAQSEKQPLAEGDAVTFVAPLAGG
jgi:molybdopterin converting factor small subunit